MTPVALAVYITNYYLLHSINAKYVQAIATNPTSVFLIGSLVASTVLASQVSSFALVGQTLTFNSNQGGIIGFLLDIVNSIMRGFNSVTQDRIEIDETDEDGSGSGSGDSLEEEDYFVLEGSGAEEEEGRLI